MDSGFIAGNAVIWWTKKAPGFVITINGGNIQLARSYTRWAHLKEKRCDSCKITIVQDD
jgi:hypothetical protein